MPLNFFLFFLFFSFLRISSWEDFEMHHELNFSLLMILFIVSFWKKIYFGLKEGTMENLLIIWDEETRPYIILSLDCLIFKEMDSCNKFQWLPTLVIFLFLSFYCPIFFLDFPFCGLFSMTNFYHYFIFECLWREEIENEIIHMKTLPDCPSVMFI